MKSASPDYSMLFNAVTEAYSAYTQLSAKGHGRTDQELARDPDYHRFHKSGVELAKLGGTEAIEGAIGLLSHLEGANAAVARQDLERLWAGMGSWTVDAAPRHTWTRH